MLAQIYLAIRHLCRSEEVFWALVGYLGAENLSGRKRVLSFARRVAPGVSQVATRAANGPPATLTCHHLLDNAGNADWSCAPFSA